MGNKHSATRNSAPEDRPRRSLWRQRIRHSTPYRPTLESSSTRAPQNAVRSRAPHSGCKAPPLRIRVMNLRQKEKLAFPLVMVEGTVENLDAANLPDNALYVQAVAYAEDDDLSNSWVGSVCWPVVRDSGHFKAYVHLSHPGAYRIRLRIASTIHQIAVWFKPRRTKWVVRFHYQKPHDSFSGFDAPSGVDNSDSEACQRIKFNAMVLQTVVAELFCRGGFSRKTFAMELDADGFPVVNVLRSKHSIAQAQRMTDSQLLSHLQRDIQAAEEQTQETLKASTANYRVKHVVLLGGSHFDKRTQKLSDCKTLVGGDMIATSACNMFTWPRDLSELTACCFNNKLVAPELSVAHCSVRQNYWANYSGGLSILLHLVGLSFGLKYQTDGIMHKRFRGITRLLSVLEPRHGMQQSMTLSRPIGDGRFYMLDAQALKPVGASSEEINLDDQSIGELAFSCRWINPTPIKTMNAAKSMAAIAA